MLLCLLACAAEDGDVLRSMPGRPHPQDGDTDTDADSDTDTDSDTDADTDTDTDADTDSTTSGPVYGIDVSHWNGSIRWSSVAGAGYGFAIAKASEGTYYTDDEFWTEYDGAADAGMIHGAYHFAVPDDSSGSDQAAYFVDNGGDWTADGQTLPGTLDIEYNPYGDTCYDMSQSEMAAWVRSFDEEYRSLTGRHAMIYTNANWWNTCVGQSGFEVMPMWVAHWGTDSPTLPTGWSEYTFWQFSATGVVSGIDADTDLDVWPYGWPALVRFADGE
jgi:GH25 family lysozyme M1 (1,4-beta-N-acetylmuramidase)